MRPFYEQYYYEPRPRKKVGDDPINDYVADVMRWHGENIADTPHEVSGKTHMTAYSELDRKEFRKCVRRGVAGYYKKNGIWPNFYKPSTFGGMNILHALTMPMPREQPADKLLVGNYIPKDLEDSVKVARVVDSWSSADDVSFDGIAPGTYYFKANHGSAFNLMVTLPCSDEEMAHVKSEAKRWLSIAYGQNSCQWWYRFIDRKVFLEADLSEGTADGPVADFKFHVINGKVALLQMYVGRGTDAKNNPIYDGNLNYMKHDFLRANTEEEPLPQNTDKARDVAIELGKKYQYCRVDLYLKEDAIILGEMTYLPNAGRRKIISPELDEMICDLWDPAPQFVRVT